MFNKKPQKNKKKKEGRREALLAGDEADELGDALLDNLLGVLSDLPISRQPSFHDSAYVRNRKKPVLLADVRRRPGALVSAALTASGTLGLRLRHLTQNKQN